jgi:hypothetical protein
MSAAKAEPVIASAVAAITITFFIERSPSTILQETSLISPCYGSPTLTGTKLPNPPAIWNADVTPLSEKVMHLPTF